MRRELKAGAAEIWVVRLDDTPGAVFLPPTEEEAERVARFINDTLGRRYLRAHAALRAVLARYTDAPLEFALAEHGKPYLASAPDLRFNLSHSQERALIGVIGGDEIGVDVERFRPMPDCLAIAERFFPPAEAAAFAAIPAANRERDFFRRWTRIEAVLKARGVGLYGTGQDTAGEWTVEECDAGAEYCAAVAVPRAGVRISVLDFAAAFEGAA